MLLVRSIASGFQVVIFMAAVVLLSGTGESLANGTNFQYQEIHSFSNAQVGDPRGKLWESADGYFYGVSGYQSSTDPSTVYRIRKDGSGYEVLHHFPDDVTCNAIMEASDGKLYGGEFMYLRNRPHRSEEHTSELQSRSGISYAAFCLKKKSDVDHLDSPPAPARGRGVATRATNA